MKYCLLDIDKLRNFKYKNSNSSEYYTEWTNKRLTYYRNSNGNEFWWEYDYKGKLIYFKKI